MSSPAPEPPPLVGSVAALEDLELAAKQRLDPHVFALLVDAAGEGIGAARNKQAMRERALVPRVLRDVAEVDTSTTVLGQRVTAPIGIAPLPRMHLVHREAERGLRDAAAATGMLFCAPTNGSIMLEELSSRDASCWFQLYPHCDDGVTRDLVARAAAVRYAAVVVTVDCPVAGHKKSEQEEQRRAGLPEPRALWR